MKKTIILTLLIALTLSFTACGKNKKAQLTEQQKRAKKGLQVKENNSLMGWLKRGKAVECQLVAPEGKIKILAQKENVRIEGVPYLSMESSGEAPVPEDGVMLTTTDSVYMWDKKTKKGTKMNNAKLNEMAGETEKEIEGEKQGSWEDMVKGWEAQKAQYSCQEVSAQVSMFEEPAGIDFIDLTETMTGLMEIGKQLEEQGEAGQAPDLKALEEIAEQLEKQGFEGVEIPENE